MKYKINIHAHSIFSDGKNSPLTMAIEAKRLGFTALVLTDHFYNGKNPEVGMVESKEHTYRKALREAREVLPVIRGMEVPYNGEEVLVFGSTAIKKIIKNKRIINLETLRKGHNCAIILCHPHVSWPTWGDMTRYVDGYERHNSGQDWFKNNKSLGQLKELQAWHNSDAHSKGMLSWGYNLVNKKITTEDELIKLIKRGKDTECYLAKEE